MIVNILPEQTLHNKMLITQAINYQKMGYSEVKINHESYIKGQPAKVGGFTPDLSAVYDDQTTLCEVVTSDLLNDTQRAEKWRTFGRSGYEFHMIIPKSALNEVKEFTKTNGINVNKFWYSKNC